LYKYFIPVFILALLTNCNIIGSDNKQLDLSEAVISNTWYDLNIEQDLFAGDVLERYSFADSEVTIDIFPMPCGSGTTFKPIVSFQKGYSINGDKQITIGDVTYEALSVTKNELVLNFENQNGAQTKKLTSNCS
jgi:hypothetical protein